jgi:spore maturation protein CgeB
VDDVRSPVSNRARVDACVYYVPNGDDYHIAELLRDTIRTVVPFGCRDVQDYIDRRVLAYKTRGATWRLRHEVRRLRPDLVYLESGYNIDPAAVAAIRRKHRVPVTMWFGDACVDEAHVERILRYASAVDRQIVVDRAVADEAARRGIGNVEFIPFFGYDHYFHPMGLERDIDVLFTGKSYIGASAFPFSAQRLDFVARANGSLGARLHVIGESWEPLGLANYANARIPERDVNVLNNRARIVLAYDATQTQDFTSCRTYHALLSGSFVITRKYPGIEKFFVNGQHLVWFNDNDEGLEMLQRYLDDPDQRSRISEAGRKHVLENGWVFSNVVRYILARGLGQETRRFEEIYSPFTRVIPQDLQVTGPRNDEAPASAEGEPNV